MSLSIQFSDLYTVTEPFFLPTVELFNDWRQAFLNANDLSKLNVMFMGNAAENFYGNSYVKTRDIDIMFSGDIECSELKRIKESAFELGLERRILIDTLHISQNVFTTKWWDNGYTVTKLFDKITVNKNSFTVPRIGEVNFIKNDCGLFEFYLESKENSFAFQKYRARLNNGIYQDLRYDLKTMKQLTYD